jgi:hypothetical protein
MDTTLATFYMARHDRNSNTWQLYRAVNNAFTLLGSYSQTLAVGTAYRLKLEVRDGTKKLLVDGVERISSTDNAITAAGRAGVRWFLGAPGAYNARFDNFVASDIVVSGVTSTGNLVSDSATITGSASSAVTGVTAAGTLNSQVATLTGTVAVEYPTSGSLASQTATLAGVASSYVGIGSSGNLISEYATLTGTVTLSYSASGNLPSQAATLTGIASAALGEVTASGNLVALNAGIFGLASVGVTPNVAYGTLTSQAATVTGLAASANVVNSSGNLTSQVATLAGSAGESIGPTAYGTLASGYATLTGVAYGGTDVGDLPETLDSTVNLNLHNSPQIEDPGAYEAILAIHSACELILREHEATKAELTARIIALEALH